MKKLFNVSSEQGDQNKNRKRRMEQLAAGRRKRMNRITRSRRPKCRNICDTCGKVYLYQASFEKHLAQHEQEKATVTRNLEEELICNYVPGNYTPGNISGNIPGESCSQISNNNEDSSGSSSSDDTNDSYEEDNGETTSDSSEVSSD